jgi:apolipoprotein N-acyltransferase
MERLAGRIMLLWGFPRVVVAFLAGALGALALPPFGFFATKVSTESPSTLAFLSQREMVERTGTVMSHSCCSMKSARDLRFSSSVPETVWTC